MPFADTEKEENWTEQRKTKQTRFCVRKLFGSFPSAKEKKKQNKKTILNMILQNRYLQSFRGEFNTQNGTAYITLNTMRHPLPKKKRTRSH